MGSAWLASEAHAMARRLTDDQLNELRGHLGKIAKARKLAQAEEVAREFGPGDYVEYHNGRWWAEGQVIAVIGAKLRLRDFPQEWERRAPEVCERLATKVKRVELGPRQRTETDRRYDRALAELSEASAGGFLGFVTERVFPSIGNGRSLQRGRNFILSIGDGVTSETFTRVGRVLDVATEVNPIDITSQTQAFRRYAAAPQVVTVTVAASVDLSVGDLVSLDPQGRIIPDGDSSIVGTVTGFDAHGNAFVRFGDG